MKKRNRISTVFIGCFLILACAHQAAFGQDQKQDMAKEDKDMKMRKEDMNMKMGDMKNWPMSSQMAVNEQMKLYGKPDEITPTMVIWHNNGPWKKTVVSKMETKHDFPKTHMDCMEQCVSYKVPLDKYNDLAMFDGSVTVDRTQGLIAARCDKQENNFLALNLAHDVITGKKTVEEARKAYGDMIKQAMSGDKPDYMKKLMFDHNGNAADSDMMTIGMN